MEIFAFRTMISLSVAAGTPAAACSFAEGIAQMLSRIRYGRGVVSVCIDTPSQEVSLDPLGDGYTCRLTGHISVQANGVETARDLAFLWRRLVQENLGRRPGISFPRFDLHPL